MAKVLLVDDESDIREMLRFTLEPAGFDCIEAGDIQDAYWKVTEEFPDIVLLDWMLPGGPGTELLRRMKKEDATKTVPVIMVTAKVHEDNIVEALEMGASDYVTKPFNTKELVARIKATLRQTAKVEPKSELGVGELHLDIDSRRVTLSGADISMGPKEFKLLQFFLEQPEHVHSRTKLLEHIWGHETHVQERTVDVHIRRLRKALQAANPAYSDLIQTVSGTGYRFSPRDLQQ